MSLNRLYRFARQFAQQQIKAPAADLIGQGLSQSLIEGLSNPVLELLKVYTAHVFASIVVFCLSVSDDVQPQLTNWATEHAKTEDMKVMQDGVLQELQSELPLLIEAQISRSASRALTSVRVMEICRVYLRALCNTSVCAGTDGGANACDCEGACGNFDRIDYHTDHIHDDQVSGAAPFTYFGTYNHQFNATVRTAVLVSAANGGLHVIHHCPCFRRSPRGDIICRALCIGKGQKASCNYCQTIDNYYYDHIASYYVRLLPRRCRKSHSEF